MVVSNRNLLFHGVYFQGQAVSFREDTVLNFLHLFKQKNPQGPTFSIHHVSLTFDRHHVVRARAPINPWHLGWMKMKGEKEPQNSSN